MLGRLYLLNEMPAPFRVVQLQDPQPNQNENLLSSGSRTKNLTYFEVTHRNMSKQHRQFGHKYPTKYHPVSDVLSPNLKQVNTNLVDDLLVYINESLYNWPYSNERQIILTNNEDHNLTLYTALQQIKVSQKHYHEVEFEDDPAGYGSHYDRRFFREVQTHDEHRATLHALARAWQQFAEQAGIVYVYAHGSLLGHFWNGYAMPWDTDHDVQMPILELNKLAKDFNHTLVVQHPSEGGHRKYLIDVNPFYAKRMHGNGNNVIDARFIDVDTGAYIDITGLARLNPNRRSVSCKNRHNYQVAQLSRLRRTQFEGYPALIPADYGLVLKTEYRKFQEPKYEDWVFNEKVRLWQYTSTCASYLKSMKFSNHVYCFPQDIKEDDGCLQEFGTCDQYVIDLFYQLENSTLSHQIESELFMKIKGKIKSKEFDEEQLGVIERMHELVGTYVETQFLSRMHRYDVANYTQM